MDHLSTDQISKFVVGDATPEEIRHAAHCSDCSSHVMRLRETLSVFRESVHQWTLSTGGSAPRTAFLQSGRTAYRMRSLRWALALALIVLIAIPVYETINERHRRMEAEDARLLEQVNAHLSRGVPAPMEPWMEFLSAASADAVGGRQ
jgi:hypothetical protein